MSFNFGGKFCDSEELESSWHNTNIPDIIVSIDVKDIKISITERHQF